VEANGGHTIIGISQLIKRNAGELEIVGLNLRLRFAGENLSFPRGKAVKVSPEVVIPP
jgi:hypothetical protein